MLTDAASRMGRLIPVSECIAVPGDPRIQLGDTVELHDRQGGSANA